MKKYSFLPSTLFLAFALNISIAPVTAQAGFQWVSPAENVVAQPPVIITGPAAPEMPSPTVISPAPAPVLAPAPVATVPDMTQAPVMTMTAPVEQPVAAPEPAAKTPVVNDNAPLRGFANNIPLVVAVRQILPSDYGFSIAQDVPMGKLVSWQGGGSWQQTLQNMLRPVGLTTQIDGMMVNIVHIPGVSAQAEAAPVLAPAPMPPTAQAPLPLVPQATAGAVADVPMMPTEHVLMPPPGAVDHMTMASDVGTADQPVAEVWAANSGDTLHKILEQWCQRAHIDLSWQAEYDYPLQAAVTFTGTFEEAVRGILAGFQDAQPQPTASLHNNQSVGQAVLVVTTRGNNYSD